MTGTQPKHLARESRRQLDLLGIIVEQPKIQFTRRNQKMCIPNL